MARTVARPDGLVSHVCEACDKRTATRANLGYPNQRLCIGCADRMGLAELRPAVEALRAALLVVRDRVTANIRPSIGELEAMLGAVDAVMAAAERRPGMYRGGMSPDARSLIRNAAVFAASSLTLPVA